MSNHLQNGGERRWDDQTKEQRDLYTQFVISFALGLGAFLSFCVSFLAADVFVSLLIHL